MKTPRLTTAEAPIRFVRKRPAADAGARAPPAKRLLEHFGHAGVVNLALTSREPLPFWLEPQPDAGNLGAPMQGAPVGCSRLLLRCRRVDGQTVLQEVVGAVDTTHRYAHLCDYRVTPEIPSAGDELAVRIGLPPPVLCHPQPLRPTYAFHDAERKPIGRRLTAGHDSRKSKPQLEHTQFHLHNAVAAPASYFELNNIPIPPASVGTPVKDLLGLANEERVIFEELVNGFRQCPCMATSMALEPFVEHPIKGARAIARKLLPGAAYYCVTGAWRTLWIRYGYDPRTDPYSRVYQVIDFRIVDEIFSQIPKVSTNRASAMADEAKRERFLLPPAQKQTLYQVRNVKDQQVQRLLREVEPTATPTRSYGYFAKSVYESFREYLSLRLTRMIKDGVPLDEDVVDATHSEQETKIAILDPLPLEVEFEQAEDCEPPQGRKIEFQDDLMLPPDLRWDIYADPDARDSPKHDNRENDNWLVRLSQEVEDADAPAGAEDTFELLGDDDDDDDD